MDDTVQNPTYIYTSPGSYSIKLTVYKGEIKQSIDKSQYVKAKSFAKLPFYEGFENTWRSQEDHLNEPSVYSNNSSSNTSVLSWGRDDDNVIFSSSYAYSPSGANNTNHSARYPSSQTNVNYQGNLDFNIDFSNSHSNKVLTFWHINQRKETSNYDFLNISLSKDGGLTFDNPLFSVRDDQDWNKQTVLLGKIDSKKGVVRFNSIGFSYSSGSTDVGIDEIKIQNLTDFSIDTTYSNNLVTVKFKDLSFGSPTSWQWDFNGDGVVDNTEQNPTFTYTKAGKYSVTLITQNLGTTDTLTKTYYITVLDSLKACFKADTTYGKTPLTVHFTDISLGNPTSWKWDFNSDGVVDDTAQNLTFTYEVEGSYFVKLIVSNVWYTDSISQEIKVTPDDGVLTLNNNCITIYPNPAYKRITVDCSKILTSKIKFEIFDVTGKLVLQTTPEKQESFSINVMSLNAGSYFLKVITNDKVVMSKFIKK